jgi:succinate-semialdehyde dehydrogenase / glutarate-semialdehyde dehydrogenase
MPIGTVNSSHWARAQNVRAAHGHTNREQTPESRRPVFALWESAVRGSRALVAQRSGYSGERKRIVCARDDHGEGKTSRSVVGEAAKCAWACRFCAENAEKFLADEVEETGTKRSYVKIQTMGPVLAMMPWNFPVGKFCDLPRRALMAGNVGLLKHASIVPQSALLIEEVFHRVRFPDGAFQTLLIESQ